MLKRKAPKEFRCPGCQELFDTEKHIPMIGSCGDSLCGVCVNEKKFKTCPVCNRRSFAWKQSNNLAMEMLAATAEIDAADSRKSKLDVAPLLAPGKPVPAILDPKNLPFLAQIVNRLNPTSFLNLASTCKTLHKYCFNCKDIKIIYNIYSIPVMMDHNGFKFGIQEANLYLKVNDKGVYNAEFLPLGYTGYRYGFLSSAYGRNKLQNYPFEFRLEEVVFDEVNRFDDALFTPLRTLFEELQIKTVTSIRTCNYIGPSWVFPAVSEDFVQFLKEFRIMHVNFDEARFDEEIDDDTLNYLLQNTASFAANQMNIHGSLLLDASVPYLNVGAVISSTTFAELIKKFADSTDDISWELRSDPFNLHDALRSCKLLPFNYNGPLPEERPIVFVKDDEPRYFWLLRNDENVLLCYKYDNGNIDLSMCSQRYYPTCLRPDVEDENER